MINIEYFMTVDGGGTKIIALLFDRKYNLIASGGGGAINPNFTPLEEIEQAMRTCIQKCIADKHNAKIKRLYISMPGPSDLFVELLKQVAQVEEIIILSEGYMGVLVGLFYPRGILALAGTGSGFFYIDGDFEAHVGGWGAILGDEGSAYHIGREGLIGAIRSYEERGSKSILENLILEEWKLKNMWEITTLVYKSKYYRGLIASIAPLVTRAASMGDKVAKDILINSGKEMAELTLSLMKKVDGDTTIPITIAGGAWKGCRITFDSFCRNIKSIFPDINIRIPIFDPVVGGVIFEILKEEGQVNSEKILQLKNSFNEFLYDTGWEGGEINARKEISR